MTINHKPIEEMTEAEFTGGVVYRITCGANGRVYIGSTVRKANQRWLEHLHYLRNGTHHSRHMQNVFNKHGEESLIFDVVEVVEDRLFVLAREQFQLWRYQGLLMNRKLTINQGISFTKEVRAKMSASRKARVMPAMTEATKRKISESNTGKKRTKESIAKNQASRLAWIEQERNVWLGMLRDGKSFRDIGRITGRSRKMIARECIGFQL